MQILRFCKDVETIGQTGYVDFGRFDPLSYFVSGSGNFDFVQGFYHGDLSNCDQSYDKLGRTSQVNIILCDNCADGRCKGGGLGYICKIQLAELLLTWLFHVRNLAHECLRDSWEIIYNGMTQFGFDKPRREFSFKTEQTHLTLYVTSIASLSTLVWKPIIRIFPENGL